MTAAEAATQTLADWLSDRLDAEQDAAEAAMRNQRLTWASVANSAAGVAGPDVGLFMLFNDPARVLADVAAKKAMLDPYFCLGDQALRLLASVYADHEGYRAEWRP